MRANRLDIKDLLRLWVDDEQEHGSFTPARRRKLLREALDYPSVNAAVQPSESIPDKMAGEVDALVGRPYFYKFQLEQEHADFEKIDFTKAHDEIQEYAPTWHEILNTAIINPRYTPTSAAAESTMRQSLHSRMYIIMATICRSRARTKSNVFAKSLGVYLQGSGVKRRVMDVISGLGLCDDYKHINALVNEKAERQSIMRLGSSINTQPPASTTLDSEMSTF